MKSIPLGFTSLDIIKGSIHTRKVLCNAVVLSLRADNGREAEGDEKRVHDRRSSVQGHVREGGGGRGEGKRGPERLADHRVHRRKGESAVVPIFKLVVIFRLKKIRVCFLVTEKFNLFRVFEFLGSCPENVTPFPTL